MPLDGRWGSGKTTVLNFVAHQLGDGWTIVSASPELFLARLEVGDLGEGQIEKTGRRVEAVLDTVRRVIAASNLVVASG